MVRIRVNQGCGWIGLVRIWIMVRISCGYVIVKLMVNQG